ncbi:hypothetical protein [Streptomyces sp. CB03238]|uniref:hypothetical protein n=1 Tax=Streptomyces sp. CB03238 TaxID=1907777 RepID=UPI000A108C57|nr:hypothetical protein [Streptomyces sp. CB03238]ORT61244.1 hypothetical protein BKD26_04010 [Streptomyces sp. CB03238]
MIDDTGAWRGEGTDSGFRLTPEQNEVVTDHWQQARQVQAELDRKLRGVQSSVAGRGGRLEGLQYSLKGLDSLRRKVAEPAMRGIRVEKPLRKNNDLHRYTLTFPAEEYTTGTKQVYEQLREQGYRPIPGSEKNTWEDPVYKGLNTTWEHSERPEKFELQFHTPESFRAKMDNHELYEISRAGYFTNKFQNEPELAKEYEQAVDLLQNERYQNVRIPPGVEELGERKVRATLNPAVRPQVIEEVRAYEAEVRAGHSAKAAGAEATEPVETATEPVVEAEVSEDLAALLEDDGPSLRDRITPPGLPAQRTQNAAPSLTDSPLPDLRQGPKGPRL